MSERGAAESGRLPEVKLAAKNLPPAYFAMVMVTGIVSIAALMLGMQFLAVVLFVVNLATYAVLIALAILRLAWFRDALLSDLADHRRAPGFFTAVAGSCLIRSQFILIAGAYGIAIVLWMASTALWIALIYGIFAALWLKHHKPSLADGINGRWLLAVVATQSVAVLGELIAAQWPQPHRIELNFLGLTLWLFGGMLYIWVIALIFYRYTFFEVAPEELTPPYWINTGAMAISTLAGSLLIETAPQAPYLDSILPFLKGFTVFYWATGSWWIPMLVILALWRYVFMRIPLRYDPLNWGAVFPLGMYAAATWRMAHAMDLGFLQPVRRQINCEGWRRDLRE